MTLLAGCWCCATSTPDGSGTMATPVRCPSEGFRLDGGPSSRAECRSLPVRPHSHCGRQFPALLACHPVAKLDHLGGPTWPSLSASRGIWHRGGAAIRLGPPHCLPVAPPLQWHPPAPTQGRPQDVVNCDEASPRYQAIHNGLRQLVGDLCLQRSRSQFHSLYPRSDEPLPFGELPLSQDLTQLGPIRHGRSRGDLGDDPHPRGGFADTIAFGGQLCQTPIGPASVRKSLLDGTANVGDLQVRLAQLPFSAAVGPRGAIP